MSERFTINNGEYAFNVYAPVDGEEACGKNGQIKGASCFGRTITLGGQELNRGSAIDFLREQVLVYNTEHADAPLALPEKGWFFGYGGTSTEDIEDIFNNLYPTLAPEEPTPIPLNSLSLEYLRSPESIEYAKSVERAAERGDNDALCTVAGYYQEGIRFEKDINKALEYFSTVSEHPYLAHAQFKMGEIYEKGEDIEQDLDRALDHYIKSELQYSGTYSEASSERIKTLFTVDEIYGKAVAYTATNAHRSSAFLFYAARQGHIQANIELGTQYKNQERYGKALNYYMCAAEQGSPYAMYLAGEILENIERFKNMDEAREYYQRAANLGHAEAIAALDRLNAAMG